MKRKTLHDITGVNTNTAADKPIPHVFHRHGALPASDDGLRIANLDGKQYSLKDVDTRMHAYGTITAGDHMVPYVSNTGDLPLRTAVREAVSNHLIVDNQIVTQRVLDAGPVKDTPYHYALNAVQHHGTVNYDPRLKAIQKQMRKWGYRMQAKVLPAMVEMAIESAMHEGIEALEAFYKQFHALFGTEKNPTPEAVNCVDPRPKETKDLEIDWNNERGIPWGDPNSPGYIPWGSMETKKLNMLPWKHPSIRSERSWKYSEFGVFKYPWRALPSSDYRCFSLSRRKYGGTILVDMSGSMSLDQADVDKLLDLAPYATIAGYGSHKESDMKGILAIIAEKSMKASSQDARRTVGGGNVVDGPALEWLAKQSAPRIWVSDGIVTGAGEQQAQNLLDDVQRITKAGRIIRINSIPELLKRLK